MKKIIKKECSKGQIITAFKESKRCAKDQNKKKQQTLLATKTQFLPIFS